jgi:hypothetical protein
MSAPATSVPPPKGLAFEVSDLLLLQSWAETHDMRMVVELDHFVEGEEYEEVLAFYEGAGARLRCWTMWRARDHFVVEPMNGGTAWRFLALPELLAELLPLRPYRLSRAAGASLHRHSAGPNAPERPSRPPE